MMRFFAAVMGAALMGVVMLGSAASAQAEKMADKGGKAAKAVSATQPAAAPEAPVGNVARIIWLDKQTNKRMPLTLTLGATQTLGTLSIRLDKCVPDMNDQPNTDAAWVQISEPGRGNDWFKGWMVNTMPEIAALEHPRYDVQVLGCGSKPRLRSGPIAKSGKAEMGVDSESVAADPYAVPGVPDTSSGTAVEAAPEQAPESEPAAEEPNSAQPAAEPAPAEEPSAPAATEAPTPAPAEPKPAAEGGAEELHRMMDGGVY